jgi:hypothetical protein
MPKLESRKSLSILAAGLVFAGLIIAVWVTSTNGDRLTARARREWKDAALDRIEKRVRDEQWVKGEVERLRAKAVPGKTNWGAWVGDEVVLMANGEWIVCQNICRKSDARIDDLFLGRGSDGRWYYSTFHFCKHKVVLMQERQPASIAEFADGYWLKPFDGRSNECLKMTWAVGQPYGDEKAQLAGRFRE